MVAQSRKDTNNDGFTHPVAGRSTRVGRYLAVRWRAGASMQAKAALLHNKETKLCDATRKTQTLQVSYV